MTLSDEQIMQISLAIYVLATTLAARLTCVRSSGKCTGMPIDRSLPNLQAL